MKAWAFQLATELVGVAWDLMNAKTQEESDRAYMDLAETAARAKIAKEREEQGG